MSKVLARWNQLPVREASEEILACCGSTAWARELTARRPMNDEGSLIKASDETWNSLGLQDWMEAFSKHPRIGGRKAPQVVPAQSAAWSAQEQQKVAEAGDSVKSALREANQDYERRFGRVFIVCAAGKSASEMLGILRRRLQNDEATAAMDHPHFRSLPVRRLLFLQLGKLSIRSPLSQCDDCGSVMGIAAPLQRARGIHSPGSDLRDDHDSECVVPNSSSATQHDCVRGSRQCI